MAKAGMLPAALAEVHPRYHTPKNAILLIGALSVISPLFGRPALVWLVNAGGLGIVVAYAFVALSFLALRKTNPSWSGPIRHPGSFTGYLALVLSVAIGALYFPGSPSALIWPQEWAIIVFWIILGALLFGLSRLSSRAD